MIPLLLLAVAMRGGGASSASAVPPVLAAAAACPPSQRVLVAARRPYVANSTPPTVMPPDLAYAYTRCGAIPVASYYVDDTRGGKGLSITYARDRIDELVHSAKRLVQHPNPTAAYGKNGWIAAAVRRHLPCVAAQRCAVIGSMDPVAETLLLAYGAAHVTTVEYNALTYEHPSLSTIKPPEFEAPTFGGAAAVFSFSSWDHDGLGRYSDPIAPDGDLLSISALRERMLRWTTAGGDGGGGGSSSSSGGCPLLFLTVPIGPDVVVWNLHRRYGRVRLPLLLAGWEVVDSEGWSAGVLDAPAEVYRSHEPVLVLRPVAATDGQSEDDARDAVHPSVVELLGRAPGQQKKKKGKKGAKAVGEGGGVAGELPSAREL